MSKVVRTLVAFAGAAIMLSALASAASANHLSVTTRTATATWTEMRFVEPLGARVVCPVTLEGSLHSSTISKVSGALIGFITRASLINSSCSGGHATILTATLPWHLWYRGFLGVLPDIEAILLDTIGSSFRVEGPFGTCLFTSSGSQPVIGKYNLSASHAVTGVEVSGSITSNEGCGPFGARVTGRLEGNSVTNTAATITLI